MAALYFYYYINSIRKIEKYLELNRPLEWEEMGKPSIFSGKYSEKNLKFRELLDTENLDELRDAQMTILWEKSKQMKQTMTVTLWSAIGMYLFTAIVVKYLYEQFLGI